MRYFYDTEFIENGVTIDLISIGIVAEDGREFYAVSSEFSVLALARSSWLMENVAPSLPLRDHRARRDGDRVQCRCIAGVHLDHDHPDVRPRAQIARGVEAFLLGDGLGSEDRDVRELWAYYSAYDHVALCQLWGRMLDLPDGVPMFTRDIKALAASKGNPELPRQVSGEHNALDDARHDKVMFDFLESLERSAP